MVNNKDNKSGYQFLSVVLLESQFKRIPKVSTDTKLITAEININHKNQIQDSLINVILELSFKAINKDLGITEIEAKIVMVGKFIQSGTPELPKKKFAQHNAPAILFPYLREHLSNLSLRAGIPPIILPPVNFVELESKKTATH